MQHKNQELPQDNYQSIIQLMQAYDCSYQQAQRHFHLLRMSKDTRDSLNHPSLNGAQRYKYEEFIHHFEVLDADTVIPFTAKEYRALKLFFSGNMHYSKKKTEPSFCQKVNSKFKDLRRKIKCLKYLSPKRLWRVIRRKRSTSNYNRLTNNDSSVSSSLKVGDQRWFEIDQDWMDQLQQNGIELTNFVRTHKKLLKQVNSISRQGVKTTLPDNMDLPPSLQPYLFVREQAAQSIASNVRIAAQKLFKIICLDNRQFTLLHNEVENVQQKTICSLAFINIFEEVQILKVYNNAADLDIEKGSKIFKHFLIKNRLFLSIIEREMNEFAFSFEEPSLEEYQSQEDDEEETRRENETHQSIIKEQDMLYQSMLSSYATKEEEKEKADQYLLQYQKRREEAKLIIREEPTSSSQTIHIVFRTPSGQTLARNFHKQDTLEYVKNWIFCEDQIEFENATSSFDLYHGYPPALVETKANQTLWSIFGEEQNKLRLIIKEN